MSKRPRLRSDISPRNMITTASPERIIVVLLAAVVLLLVFWHDAPHNERYQLHSAKLTADRL